MGNICFHRIAHDYEQGHYYCEDCGKSFKGQNIKEVECPECHWIFKADFSDGVMCENCELMFQPEEVVSSYDIEKSKQL